MRFAYFWKSSKMKRQSPGNVGRYQRCAASSSQPHVPLGYSGCHADHNSRASSCSKRSAGTGLYPSSLRSSSGRSGGVAWYRPKLSLRRPAASLTC
jgi:hypothetical protein